ncbi:MAG: ribulose 1,5-bisphosphate carboxylase [Sphaerobacteraceae bacterium]|nr:MAG: ribulose 1,5-bisphosphate carboxylase [Sphaerobacteraceae bacterium]
MTSDRILATYLLETPFPLETAAEAMAGEQSSGTFVAVPGETDELRLRHRATVEQIDPLEPVSEPSLPGSKPPTGSAGYNRARVTISFPFDNVGTNLPTLLSTVAGNLYELREVSGLKLIDLEFPAQFADAHPGPQFGIAGTRQLIGVHEGPLIGTIVKPSVGLTPEQTADLVRELGEADIDFIKDDELMADPPHSPLERRVEQVMGVINELSDRTGKKLMYAFNITDDIGNMLRHHETIKNAGGTCVMVSLNSVGMAGVAYLRKHCELPIHGHRNGWGMLTRHPWLGISFRAYHKLWRLIGIDHIHVNALQNKFWEPDESVVDSVNACLEPLLSGYRVMPVLSSGQWGGQAPETWRLTGTTDLMYLAGGGIVAHPGGPAAGVRAIRQAWEAAVSDIDLHEYSATHPELQQSIEAFGKRDG